MNDRESKETSGLAAETEAEATEAVDPLTEINAALDDLKAHIDDVKGRLPEKGPVTLNRWRIIDGSLGEVKDQVDGIRALAKAAYK